MTLDRASAVLSGLLLAVMALLYVFIVVGAVAAVRKVRREVLPIEGPLTALPPFRWTPRQVGRDAIGSRLLRWDPLRWPQVRRAWPSTAEFERWEPWPDGDELWLSYGSLGGHTSEDWLEMPATTADLEDAVARYRISRGLAGRVLDIRDREAWRDVSPVLAAIRDTSVPGETWVLRVWSKGRGVGDWRWRMADAVDEDAPGILFEGRVVRGRTRVRLRVGDLLYRFPFEPTARELEAEQFGLDSGAIDGDAVLDPFDSTRFVEAANRAWRGIEAGIRWGARARTSVVLSIVETEGAPVRWGYVVAALDVLTSAGVDVVRLEPGGHTLRLDVPDDPDILLAWTPPPTPSTLLALLGGLAGIWFAVSATALSPAIRRRGPSRSS